MISAPEVQTRRDRQLKTNELEAFTRAAKRNRWNRQERRGTMRSILRSDQFRRDQILCALDPIYFIGKFCMIFDDDSQGWVSFQLWAEQEGIVDLFHRHRKVVVLKARQLGLSWLALAYALWLMVFRPPAIILVFSRSQAVAWYLISDERLKGMYDRLPPHLRPPQRGRSFVSRLRFHNGSVCFAFPTTGGDGYTATLAIVDEADLIPRLPKLMRAVKPTVDSGGKLFLISRSNKDLPDSMYKQIYRGAKTGADRSWVSAFLEWSVRPSRTASWYEDVKAEIVHRTHGMDEMWEQYPATDDEALRPAVLNKRIPAQHLEQCLDPQEPMPEGWIGPDMPLVPGMAVYTKPVKGKKYFIGADTAEGQPTSHNSATYVIDDEGAEVAHHVDKIHPTAQARAIRELSLWYNNATIMVENNYHGFTTLEWLKENGMTRRLARSHDGKKVGWTTTQQSKHLLYEILAENVRNHETVIRDNDAYLEIQSIGRDLKAPPGRMDDRADAFALALAARQYGAREQFVGIYEVD